MYTVYPLSFAFAFCRFSASEALKHPWITGEGHFDVHKRHMPDVSKTFRDTFGKKVLPDRPGHLGPTGKQFKGYRME